MNFKPPRKLFATDAIGFILIGLMTLAMFWVRNL